MGMPFVAVAFMAMPFVDMALMGMPLMAVAFVDMALMGMPFVAVAFMDMALMAVAFMGMAFTAAPTSVMVMVAVLILLFRLGKQLLHHRVRLLDQLQKLASAQLPNRRRNDGGPWIVPP